MTQHTEQSEREELIAALRQQSEGERKTVQRLMLQAAALLAEDKPVDMVLYCPKCGLQHIDAPDERTPDWSNPPHKSHLCHGCGHIWRPSDTPTNGVARTASGKDADTAPLLAEDKAGGEPVISAGVLSRMFKDLEGLNKGQWGYHYTKGWNDALRLAMNYTCH